MLQNSYFLAKIGADTAENEQHFAEILTKNWRGPRASIGDAERGPDEDRDLRGSCDNNTTSVIIVHGERANFTRLVLGCIEAKFCK